jgi:hypothetical protein
MTQPSTPDELDPTGELAAELARADREYGTYVANQPIFAGNARAYNQGDPVPASNVVRHGYWLNGQVDLVHGREHDPAVAAPTTTEDDAATPADGVTVLDDDGAADAANPGG